MFLLYQVLDHSRPCLCNNHYNTILTHQSANAQLTEHKIFYKSIFFSCCRKFLLPVILIKYFAINPKVCVCLSFCVSFCLCVCICVFVIFIAQTEIPISIIISTNYLTRYLQMPVFAVFENPN